MTTEVKADSSKEIEKTQITQIEKTQIDKDKKNKEAMQLKRESYIKTLEDLGVDTKGLTDEQLLFKVVGELNKTNSQLASAQAKNEAKSVEKYTVGIDHKLKDKEFITRLFNLNVPNFYLHIFSDDDALITDAELWKKVNASKINPFKSIKDIVEARNRYHY